MFQFFSSFSNSANMMATALKLEGYMPPSPTQQDIADMAQVSRSMVSHVLRGRTDLGISEETRRKVLKAMQQLGYRPRQRVVLPQAQNLLAVSMGDGVVGSFENPFFASSLRGMYDAAQKHDYHLMLLDTILKDQELVPALAEHRTQGALHLGYMGPGELERFHSIGMPICIVNAWCREGNVDCYAFDGKEAGFTAVDYLNRQGHRHIIHFAGPQRSVFSTWFRQGFEQRAKELELKPVVLDFPTQFGMEIDRRAGQEMARLFLYERNRRFRSITAILGTNDRLTMGVMEWMGSEQIKIPDDLSIMGMGDITEAQCTIPPLTTLSVPTYEMGRMSVERLIERINDPGKLSQRIMLPVNQVCQRDSVRHL